MVTLVKISLIVKIPSQVVYIAYGALGVFNGGVKCTPDVTIDLDKAGTASMVFATPSWGKTHRYDAADTTPVAGKPDWYRNLRAGAAEQESGTLTRTEQNLNALFTSLDRAHAVKFVVEGANPLVGAAPAISAEIIVGVRKKAGGVFECCIQGEHDGFPDYTVLVNDKAAYSYGCVNAGESPTALFPPMDKAVNTGWKPV